MEISQILNPADLNPKRFTTADKYFAKRLDFKDMKKKKKNSIGISIFDYENKEQHPTCNIYVSKKIWKKTCSFIIDRRRRQKTLCSYQRF